VEDGINAVRVFLPKCWFDANKCARGIDALKLYRAAYDDKLQALRPQPVHDWTSHAADSFRYLALTRKRKATRTGFHCRIAYSQLGVVWAQSQFRSSGERRRATSRLEFSPPLGAPRSACASDTGKSPGNCEPVHSLRRHVS
jgi:hypothetical protein